MPCVHSYVQHGQYNDERVHQKDARVCNTESVQGRIRTVNSADSIHITRVYLTLHCQLLSTVTDRPGGGATDEREIKFASSTYSACSLPTSRFLMMKFKK